MHGANMKILIAVFTFSGRTPVAYLQIAKPYSANFYSVKFNISFAELAIP